MQNNGILDRFLEDTKNHELTINLDQGLYRDLTIAIPGCSDYHYHITTRPGYLFFSGDMGSFTFSRLPDMFNFFRSNTGRINPWYWHEKLEAECKRSGSSTFDFEGVREQLKEYLSDYVEDLDTEDEDDQSKIEEATEAVDNFCNYLEESEWEYIHAINEWDPDFSGGLTLDEFWDSRPEKLTHHYIWACHAIVHAIKLYDASKINKEVLE